MRIIKGLWWLSLIIGIFFLSFGLVAIIKPEILLSFITTIVGVGYLFVGSKELITGLTERNKKDEWWSYLIYAALNLALGFLLILNPHMSLVVVLYYLAFWAIFRGLSQVVFGVKFPIFKNITITSGIVIIIMGLLILFYPEDISEVLMTIIGVVATIFGISQIIQATNRRNMFNDVKTKVKNAVVIDTKNSK